MIIKMMIKIGKNPSNHSEKESETVDLFINNSITIISKKIAAKVL